MLILAQENSRVTPDKNFEEFSLTEIEQSVPQRFEKQVDKYPNSLAIKDRNQALTYRELNEFANQIAHGILNQGNFQDAPIALLFEQGINFIGAILGTLKAGKCYVPIDPSFPKARNLYMLEDSQAYLILTNTKNLDVAKSLSSGNYQILNIDDLPPELPKNKPNIEISPDTLAYIIYTSGSTGKPKGVFQNHRNLLHNAMNQINAFHLGIGDRMPLVHSCSVMGAVRVIYNALLSGTALYPFDVKNQSLDELSTLLKTEKITVFHSVATLFRHFSDIFKEANSFPALRLVILGGEAMSRKDVEFYKQTFPDNCLLCTGLGSTEAGTTRVFMLNKQTEITTAQVPPGYAVDGVNVLLWDEHGCEVPIGEVGEIVIESEYLALGYWQKQQANAEMFVPISPTSSIRRFRTGDLGKFLPNGCLVHLGRKDFQVKIRGYRIDVAEVEMALMDSNLLKEVVVVGQELNPGELSLVAYCVLLKQSGVAAKQLRRVIRQSLPDYMMPSLFIFLDALPLTPNGKLDRKALPMPDRSQQTIGTVFVPAQTTLEKEISQIWCNLLNLNRVGINDNFFDLGGNSIVAAQFFSKIEQKIGQYLPLALLAEAPTIKEIADLIQRQNWTDSWSSLVPLQSYGDRLPLFICHGINGNVLNLKNLVDELDSQQPVYGLQAQGLDGETVPFTSIEAIAAHYIQMIQRVQLQGPYYIGGYSFGGKVAFEMACQLKQQGHEVALLFLLDTYSPYGLQRISDIPLSLFGRAKLHWKRFSTGGTSYLVERFQYRLNQFNFLTKTSDETAILVNKDENLNTISQASERIKNANLQARKNYNPNFYSGKITLFRAVPGRPIPEGWRVDSLLGWGDLSSSIEVHKLYGNHGSFLNYPHVTEFANILSQCIKEATLLH